MASKERIHTVFFLGGGYSVVQYVAVLSVSLAESVVIGER